MKRCLIFLFVSFSFFSCFGMRSKKNWNPELEKKCEKIEEKKEQLKKLDDDFCDKFLKLRDLLKQFDREKAAREKKKEEPHKNVKKKKRN